MGEIHHFLFNTSQLQVGYELSLKSINDNYYCSIHTENIYEKERKKCVARVYRRFVIIIKIKQLRAECVNSEKARDSFYATQVFVF